MSELVLKVLIAAVGKLVTEKFFCRFVVITLSEWAKKSENQWDDQVVQAMADALEVPVSLLKKVDA